MGALLGCRGVVWDDAVELSMSELLDDADGDKDSRLSKFEWRPSNWRALKTSTQNG
jgi:hypothetical protein